MWRRHRWMVPYAGMAGVLVFLLAGGFGFGDIATRVAVGIAASAVAVNATSEYRILAATTEGLVLCRASRIRQYAVDISHRLPPSTTLAPVGGTVLATDWQVGDVGTFTVPKSSERAIGAIAHG